MASVTVRPNWSDINGTPNVAPGSLNVNTNSRREALAFNTALFSLPPLGRLGNTRRRYFYGPGIGNFDTAIEKNVKLTELKSLKFRVEVFNTFNHPQFFGSAAVNGDISSTSFGRIVNAD